MFWGLFTTDYLSFLTLDEKFGLPQVEKHYSYNAQVSRNLSTLTLSIANEILSFKRLKKEIFCYFEGELAGLDTKLDEAKFLTVGKEIKAKINIVQLLNTFMK